MSEDVLKTCDVVIDAGGATVTPGLIDSHVHITFGDYTPRQKTVGFLESYLHGGVTTAITACEVHVPGRPSDVEGVKALAIAAQRCFAEYRPGGMRVHAGSIIIEPELSPADYRDVAAKGVWLAKAGFGAFDDPMDYAPHVKAARAAGLITTMHTGGASIPGSQAITGAHVLAADPHVSFHVNGGPVAIGDEDFSRLLAESEVAMQICTAGNLRTSLLCARLCVEQDRFDRLLIATDTPTGSGIMPLGMIYTMTHLASLGGIDPALVHCGRHRQQCGGLWPRHRGAGSGPAGRHRDHGRPPWRHKGNRARCHRERRSGGDRLRDVGWRAALCRPQPQHPADHPHGAGGQEHSAPQLRHAPALA